ncbi:hypothetical protein EJ110_NYTH45995, partial [Nymphaea thermarum]
MEANSLTLLFLYLLGRQMPHDLSRQVANFGPSDPIVALRESFCLHRALLNDPGIRPVLAGDVLSLVFFFSTMRTVSKHSDKVRGFIVCTLIRRSSLRPPANAPIRASRGQPRTMFVSAAKFSYYSTTMPRLSNSRELDIIKVEGPKRVVISLMRISQSGFPWCDSSQRYQWIAAPSNSGTVHPHCSSALFTDLRPTLHRSSLVTVHLTPLFTRHCSSLFTPDDRACSLTRRHCSLLTPDACSSVWLRLCLCATSLPSPGRSSPVVRRLRLHLRLAPPPELFPVVSASVRRRLPLSFPVLLEGLFPLLTSGTARVFSAPAILCSGSGDLLISMAASSSSTVNQTEIGGVRTENVPMQVINLHLTKENYFSWSPAMTMGIAARDRMTYIDGSNPEPARTSGVWRTWFLEDNQVKTWIVNSVSPDIQPLILRKKTARDMWVVLEQMYGQKKTDIRTYQVMKTVYNLRQGSSFVAEYYGALKAKWEELDYHSDLPWHCPQDQALHVAQEWKNRVFLFLAGLNDEFE